MKICNDLRIMSTVEVEECGLCKCSLELENGGECSIQGYEDGVTVSIIDALSFVYGISSNNFWDSNIPKKFSLQKSLAFCVRCCSVLGNNYTASKILDSFGNPEFSTVHVDKCFRSSWRSTAAEDEGQIGSHEGFNFNYEEDASLSTEEDVKPEIGEEEDVKLELGEGEEDVKHTPKILESPNDDHGHRKSASVEVTNGRVTRKRTRASVRKNVKSAVWKKDVWDIDGGDEVEGHQEKTEDCYSLENIKPVLRSYSRLPSKNKDPKIVKLAALRKNKCGDEMEEPQSSESANKTQDETTNILSDAIAVKVRSKRNVRTVSSPDHKRKFRKTKFQNGSADGLAISGPEIASGDSSQKQKEISMEIGVNGEKKFTCPHCTKCFRSKDQCQTHLRIHTGEKPFMCHLCGKSFYTMHNLRTHMLTGEKPHKCPSCSKSFTQVSSLNVHKRTHTGMHPHQCPTCGKSFTQPVGLKMHLLTHTREMPHKCPSCSMRFSRVSSLKIHKCDHTGVDPHQCPTCGKCFTKVFGLRLHSRLHNGEKPYKCTSCSKSFTQAGSLRAHNRIHTGEKPFRCPTCSAAFSQAHTLKHHLQTHTGAKPYLCSTCAKTFYSQQNLDRHILTHTGVKPFKCHSCDKRFTQSSNLKIHIRTHGIQAV